MQFVKPTLRMPVDLHAKLVREAKKSGVTLNKEATRRLRESFEAPAIKDIETVAENMVKAWGRIRKQMEPAE
jgi:hypothetical protein